jgi:hypothetical protein
VGVIAHLDVLKTEAIDFDGCFTVRLSYDVRRKAMYEHENIRFGVAQLLQKGHLRRSADIGLWLRQYLEGHRLTKWPSEATPRVLKRMVSLIGSPRRRTVQRLR